MNSLTVNNSIMSEMHITMSVSENEGHNFHGLLAEVNRFTIEIRNLDGFSVSPNKKIRACWMGRTTIDSAVFLSHRHPVQGVTWS